MLYYFSAFFSKYLTVPFLKFILFLVEIVSDNRSMALSTFFCTWAGSVLNRFSCSYFFSIQSLGNNLAASIYSVDVIPMDFMPPKQSNSLFLYPITSVEIEVEINNLNSSKATGPFSIPINILKITKEII